MDPGRTIEPKVPILSKKMKRSLPMDNTIIRADKDSEVFANGSSLVHAYDNATVYAHDNTRVIAFGNARVLAHDNSGVNYR